MKHCRKLEQAATRRRVAQRGHPIIPPAVLHVTLSVAAHIVGINESVVETPLRTTAVIQARQLRDQMLLEAGYREASIAQATGRNMHTVLHSVQVLERRAERGTVAMAEVSRARGLMRARLGQLVKR